MYSYNSPPDIALTGDLYFLVPVAGISGLVAGGYLASHPDGTITTLMNNAHARFSKHFDQNLAPRHLPWKEQASRESKDQCISHRVYISRLSDILSGFEHNLSPCQKKCICTNIHNVLVSFGSPLCLAWIIFAEVNQKEKEKTETSAPPLPFPPTTLDSTKHTACTESSITWCAP